MEHELIRPTVAKSFCHQKHGCYGHFDFLQFFDSLYFLIQRNSHKKTQNFQWR